MSISVNLVQQVTGLIKGFRKPKADVEAIVKAWIADNERARPTSMIMNGIASMTIGEFRGVVIALGEEIARVAATEAEAAEAEAAAAKAEAEAAAAEAEAAAAEAEAKKKKEADAAEAEKKGSAAADEPDDAEATAAEAEAAAEVSQIFANIDEFESAEEDPPAAESDAADPEKEAAKKKKEEAAAKKKKKKKKERGMPPPNIVQILQTSSAVDSMGRVGKASLLDVRGIGQNTQAGKKKQDKFRKQWRKADIAKGNHKKALVNVASSTYSAALSVGYQVTKPRSGKSKDATETLTRILLNDPDADVKSNEFVGERKRVLERIKLGKLAQAFPEVCMLKDLTPSALVHDAGPILARPTAHCFALYVISCSAYFIIVAEMGYGPRRRGRGVQVRREGEPGVADRVAPAEED